MTRILKSPEILDKTDPEDSNVCAPNIIDIYENRPDYLDDMCLAIFASSYVYEKVDISYESDNEKSYIKPAAEIRE